MYVGMSILTYSARITISLCKVAIEAAIWLTYQRRPYNIVFPPLILLKNRMQDIYF